MTTRVWDRYLSVQDRSLVAHQPIARPGPGSRPALLLIDLYRAVFGDRPEPVLDAVAAWPASCGLAGWAALPSIQRLLEVARDIGLPIVHTTGTAAVAHWRSRTGGGGTGDLEVTARRTRGYEIMAAVAPLSGELVLAKAAPSAFWGTPLLAFLAERRVDTLIVTGESTSGCVRATVVDGASHRYRVVVVEDGVFDRHEAAHAINLFDMDRKYADVVGLDEALAYMHGLGPAAAPASAQSTLAS